MKKVLVVTVLVVSMGFLGLQQAFANKGRGDECQKGVPGYSQLDAASKAKVDKFYNETRELRKQMVMKHAEEVALMNAVEPDAAKIAKLAGDIFDLKTAIQAKAKDAGVQGLIGCGCGHGRRHGMGRGMMNAGLNNSAGAATSPAGGVAL